MQHKLPGYFRLAVALWLHEEMTGYKTWRCRLLRWSVCRRSDKGATRCVDAWLPYDPRPNPINSLLGCLLNTEPKKCFISGRLSNSILLIYAKTYPNPCQRCTQHNNSELIFISQGPNRRKYKWKNRSENMPIPCPPCPPANRSIVPSILSACHLPVPVNKWPVFHPPQVGCLPLYPKALHKVRARFAGHNPHFMRSLSIQGVRFNWSFNRA